MSFADSLQGLAHSKENDIMRSMEHETRRLVSFAEEGVKYAATEAAKNNKKSVEGYLCTFAGIEESPFISLLKEWNDDDKTAKQKQYIGRTPNIYRIDRLIPISDYALGFETRYPKWFGNEERYNTVKNSSYYLSEQEINDICDKIGNMIRGLGFKSYEVRPAAKKFYFEIEETTNGLFGLKHINKRKDDGVGKVVYISVKW